MTTSMPPKTFTTQQKASFDRIKPKFGSTTSIHGRGCIVICGRTGKHVENAILEKEIKQRIIEEQAALRIVFSLRDKCLQSATYEPTDDELRSAISALKIVWFLLPRFERHTGEKNHTFYLRILREVGKFRRVNMFYQEEDEENI